MDRFNKLSPSESGAFSTQGWNNEIISLAVKAPLWFRRRPSFLLVSVPYYVYVSDRRLICMGPLLCLCF